MEEQFLEKEARFVLKAAQPGVSARELAWRYGLEELRDYIARSRKAIDKLRVSNLLQSDRVAKRSDEKV